MAKRRGWVVAIGLGVALVGLLACGGSADDGYVFLAKYAPQWQVSPTPAVRQVAVRPTASPARPVATPITSFGAGGKHEVDQAGRPILVYLDPGHGGVDQGTRGLTADGEEVLEKTVTLAVAQRTAALLRNDGIGVVLSRTDDSLPGSQPADYTADGTVLTPAGVLRDLQRRIDRANASGAQVLLSLHQNGFTDPAVGGSETFFDPDRPFSAENERLAHLVQSDVIASLHDAGLDVPDRGVTDDTTLQGDDLGALGVPYNHLVLLGPAVPGKLQASQLPGALSEPLFLTNPPEANAVSQPEIQDALARAYSRALEDFLRQ
jgi:N-acetylmuramoyl-L-alanine amidase